MNTIGSYLYLLRRKKNITLDTLENETKIKKEFIRAIEREKWDQLPEYPVVTGFAKRIINALGGSENKALALLRRDYPPRAISPNPKPDVLSTFSWSPRLTFFFGVLAFVIIIVAYLIFQYRDFRKAPELVIRVPNEGQVITEDVLTVEGTTDEEATVRINNQPVIIDSEGNFKAEIEIFSGTKELVIRSESRSGKVTEITRTIETRLEE